MICQESVYDTRLKCGHWLHHTCLLQLNSERWFDDMIDIKCPICRQHLTDSDKNRFFIMPLD